MQKVFIQEDQTADEDQPLKVWFLSYLESLGIKVPETSYVFVRTHQIGSTYKALILDTLDGAVFELLDCKFDDECKTVISHKAFNFDIYK